MKKSNRILSVLLILLLTAGMLAAEPEGMTETGLVLSSGEKDTIYIWYTDEALTDYISSAALAFYDEENVRVVPVLYSGAEYLESLYDSSVSGDAVPDLYILGADSLEKAAMAGLAVPVQDDASVLTQIRFPKVALNAVTYKEQYFGYPFYYETAYLLYNETYLKQIAQSLLLEEMGAVSLEDEDAVYSEEDAEDSSSEEAEGQSETGAGTEEAQDGSSASSDGAESGSGEYAEENQETEAEAETAAEEETDAFAAPEGYSEAQWNDLMTAKLLEMIPHSIEDILNFADEYDAPENTENIFLWDVSDIFYNYFFAGAYMDVGGEHGDDSSVVEIYSQDTIECLEVYQDLNQFFSIDSKESSYEDVLDTFLQGKTIFTIATTDAISKLDSAIADGSFPYDYNVAALPGIDDEHEAVGLSVTDAVVINGYSEKQQQANAFAKYLVYDAADGLLGRTGKMPATVGEDDYVTDARDLVRQVYRQSVSLPKALEFSNFWLQLELAYTKIWDGEDVNDTLKELSETIKTQVSGTAVEEERIELQEEEQEEENTED